MSNQIIGHKKVIDFLNKSVQGDKTSHAYLFEGPERIGKKLVALEFAEALQNQGETFSNTCLARATPPGSPLVGGGIREAVSLSSGESKINPDLIVLDSEKGESIVVAQIRELQSRLSLFPYSKKRKVAIINRAEAMTEEAANSLLKTLEEPSLTTAIILITSLAGNILPTIKSRCQQVKFLIPSEEELKVFLKDRREDDERIKQLISLSCQRPGIMMKLLDSREFFERRKKDFEKFSRAAGGEIIEKMNYAEEISGKDPGEIENILDLWLVVLRNSFLNCYKNKQSKILKQKIIKAIKAVREGKSLILNKKANPKLVLENILINC